jgi:methylase of polypeptide subunit release factors
VETAAFLRSDWFASVRGDFDLIVSNPPYIAASDMPGLAPEVRFDPDIALTPGGDGLDAYRAIARTRSGTCPGGRLIVEIGHDQGRTSRRFSARRVLRMSRSIPISTARTAWSRDGAPDRRKNGHRAQKNPQKYAVLRV